jgi:lipoyl(octanoyl) transferase
MKKIEIKNLGKIKYSLAFNIQKQEKEKVKNKESSGSIFLLEHVPPVITIGRNATKENLLVTEEFLNKNGFELEKTSRGGDITVHEPGQLVIYYVLPLCSKQVKAFIDKVIKQLKDFLKNEYNIKASYKEEKPGLWYKNQKLCSIGFDLTSGVSMHGIALNVSNDMKGFSLIVPCGLQDIKMTSISKILGTYVSIEEASFKMINYLNF